VRANFRTAITIPERSWIRFRDVISEFAGRQVGQHSVSGVVSGVSGSAGDAGGCDKELSTTSLVGGDTASATTSATNND